MSNKLRDILAGVKSSKTEAGSTGKNPGVDYSSKAGDKQKFVSKHKIEKHDHRSGNKDDIFQATNVKYSMDDPKMKNFGHKKGKDEAVTEAKETEEAKCNSTAKGTKCPVHGMAECSMSKPIKEEELEQVDEVLTKKSSAGEWIHDFVHSDNPKFAGKSKKERTKQALAAYYAKQRNEAVEPLLGSADSDDGVDMVKAELKALANKAMHLVQNMPESMHVEPWVQAKIAQAKAYVSDVHDYCIYGNHQEEDESAPADTPMTFPSMNVDTARI